MVLAMGRRPISGARTPIQILFVPEKSIFTSLTPPLLDHHRNQSDQNKTIWDVLGGLWVLGRMFGHEFHALLIFQKFLISDDFAALFGKLPPLITLV